MKAGSKDPDTGVARGIAPAAPNRLLVFVVGLVGLAFLSPVG